VAAVRTGRIGIAALSAALLLAPALPAQAASQETGRYIVVLRSRGADARAVSQRHVAKLGGQVKAIYQHALSGYVANLTPSAAARLARDPAVASVERDQKVHMVAQTTPTGVDRVAVPATAGNVAPLPIDTRDDVRVDVDVAVIDTGVDFTHPDLNVVARTDCTGDGVCDNNAGTDGNGHGSHVAGSVGALDNKSGVVGVAPGARIHAVRVLDNFGNGDLSWVMAGVDWVTARAGTIEVANMSLGCICFSPGLSTAITNSVAAGVTHVVAAGNDDINAANFFPANHADVITVSALADFNGVSGGGAPATCRSDVDDTLANFSNFGSTIEIAAPGVCILSTWMAGGYATISGTSMAAPHVAGAAGLLASHPAFAGDPALIESTLVSAGNFGWTDDSGDGIQEPLLDVSSFAAPVTVSSYAPLPQLSVDNVWVSEPDAGSVLASFTVSLAPAAAGPVTVKVATSNSSATAPADYTALPSTTLTFAAGETSKTVNVNVVGDTIAEGVQTFNLNLSAPTGAVIADTQGSASIVDTEAPITASVDNLWLAEGDAGSSTATFTVALSQPATHTMTVKVKTNNSTALAGSDYTALPLTTLTFAPGESSKTVDVSVTGDTRFEGNEVFSLSLSSPTASLVVADSQGAATIVDEEGPLTVRAANTGVLEGDTGTSPLTYTLTLSNPPAAGQTVTVKAASANGTATAGSDYTALPLTTVTFGPGETSKTVTVNVTGDTTIEATETVLLNLSAPTGGLIVADSQATGDIAKDD